MQMLLVEKGWSKEELLDSIDDFTCQDLQEFIPKFLTQGIFIESLVFGNISKEVI
jgi:secreted Zn-dependent insulinase-like peptidase